MQSLSHPEPMTQMRAVYLLGAKKTTQAVGALAELFRRTSNPFLKSEVVEAVAKIGGESACSLLMEALQDLSFIVRAEVFSAMSKFSDRNLVERAVEHALNDPSSFVCDMAREAIDSLESANQKKG